MFTIAAFQYSTCSSRMRLPDERGNTRRVRSGHRGAGQDRGLVAGAHAGRGDAHARSRDVRLEGAVAASAGPPELKLAMPEVARVRRWPPAVSVAVPPSAATELRARRGGRGVELPSTPRNGIVTVYGVAVVGVRT